ncbi:hypothetical protein QAD02_012509 [Eretmocerus hayati]|uniref:Uncharacterized protein n=1 Tax=Eretmocerus hayati TaxID=131215 RepID=A0ACC2P2N9_9HYME|nr:hypothetical protein QAD02_012509 [Eretmocerus hayati]
MNKERTHFGLVIGTLLGKSRGQTVHLSGIISTDKVFDTMCQVDRGKYTHSTEAYVDEPRSIGFNATISAPHMHAYALEYLSDKLCGGRALDIGSGSGYLTTCMALMNGPTGTVIGIEHMPELQEVARRNIESDHPELLRNGRIKLVVGDGRLGYPSEAPFDAIHVGAASSETPNSVSAEDRISQICITGTCRFPRKVALTVGGRGGKSSDVLVLSAKKFVSSAYRYVAILRITGRRADQNI